MRTRVQRHITGLDFRFLPEAADFARAQLEGKKVKTLWTPYGNVSFRKTPTSHEITDPQAALDWAKLNAPAIVRVREDVLKSDVVKAVAELTEDGVAPETPFLLKREGGERCYVHTGTREK